ncbi:MAG: sugar kinase [Devosia sp. 67-54]|uniref:ROK family protein n=1 Tax=unclassified Devosia TaxID=196773 RepID=UPI000967CADC|nr:MULTISPECIES: ROK family protein [unclassified Devosia]MBN9305575.1 ROK family protein [Devosia sp.]OJX19152.1 MAG: sugar kinase [Devosia sp. 67-54]
MTRHSNQDVPARLAIGSNPERNRRHNRRVVLEAVRTHGALGRTEIGRLTRLTAQAVANIVDDLVRENFLVETGRLRSGRGQPPIQFAVNPDGPVTVGVELAADHLTTVLLDLTGSIRAQSSKPIAEQSPRAMARRVAREIGRLRASVNRPAPMLGVGVVMPGPFEIEGIASAGPGTLPGWHGIDAAAVLAEAIGEAVIIENDATAAAVGERLHGAGRAIEDFCFVYFGVGLGLGIVQGGRPMRGAFGNAGEIGLIPLSGRNGRVAGALERFASPHALRERLAAAGVAAPDVATIEALFQSGDPALAAWIGEAADYLAQLVVTLENILDPETIVFGGRLPDAVIDAIIAALEPLPPSIATRAMRAQPRVRRGQTGQLTAALGAAALPLFETVTPRLHLAATPAGAETNQEPSRADRS